MGQKRKDIIAANEISEVRTYLLGGYEQKVLIEGLRASSPIAVFLHGGPGFPFPFSVGCRGLFPEITDNFVAVFWDQFGCGINDHVLSDSISIDDFVAMTIDLVMALREDFPNNSINLVGISWGSVLAAKTVLAIPELIDHVLISGQVIRDLIFNDEVYKALQASAMASKQKNQLAEIFSKSTHSLEDTQLVTKWIRKYTEGQQVKADGGTSMSAQLWGLLSSPDYSLGDFKSLFINGYAKNKSLSQDLFTIDLSETLEAISIPYLILQGSNDLVTPTKMVSELLAQTDNENLRLCIIENSGHMPGEKAMETILKEAKALFLF